ncbi:hypothetical protein GDO86_009149 [Hymenochirus boettgeri]|uniref:G-protein coupled receptors family 1 profile domain-containing protein n=1 Tax=Hymenochirus boettgeri TaxID=247094 RepID=A0A8T2JK25_9PIPI|nr:hypothetical protein GDO86_009149 [Hymenochirus boettgeri]
MNTSSITTNRTDDLILTLNAPYTSIEIVIAVTATLGNLLVCVAVIQDRKLRTVTNYFLVSLSLADVCVGAIAIPCAILTSIGLPHNNLKLCTLMLSILIMLTLSSMLSLVSIAVDRYIAILNPLRYKSIMTPRNTFICILCSWSLSAVGGLLPVMGWHKSPSTHRCLFTQVIDMNYVVSFFTFIFFVLPLISMLLIYARIFSEVRRQIQVTAKLVTKDSSAGKKETSIKREIKTATSLFTIVFLFVLCWAPLHVMNALILFCLPCYIPPILLDTAIILSHANSALNPILCAYKLKSFRNKFIAVFCHRNNNIKPGAQAAHHSNIFT